MHRISFVCGGVHSSCYCCILDTMTTALMIADHIVSIYHTMCNVQYGNVVNEETSAAVAVVSTTGVTCDAIWRTMAADYSYPA